MKMNYLRFLLWKKQQKKREEKDQKRQNLLNSVKKEILKRRIQSLQEGNGQ